MYPQILQLMREGLAVVIRPGWFCSTTPLKFPRVDTPCNPKLIVDAIANQITSPSLPARTRRLGRDYENGAQDALRAGGR